MKGQPLCETNLLTTIREAAQIENLSLLAALKKKVDVATYAYMAYHALFVKHNAAEAAKESSDGKAKD